MLAIDRRKRRDLARVGLQTGAAVGLVYVVMRWYALDHLSWAIISALFSIQLNADSTLSVGVSRVVAALIGTALGLGTVVLFTDVLPGSWPVLAALVTASVIANLMTTLRPSLTYIAVAAAIVALNADAELVEALERALAIMIGSVGAGLASLVVWPDTARARAVRNIAYALDDCRRLVEASLRGLEGADAEDTRRIDEAFKGHLANAREIVGDARFRPRLGHGHTLSKGLVAIERLWYGTIVLDRAAEERRASLHREDIHGDRLDMDAVRAEIVGYLDGVVSHLRGRAEAPPGLERVVDRLRAAEDALRRTTPETSLSPDADRERAISALRFGIDEVRRNLEEIDELVADGRDDLERRAGGDERGDDRRLDAAA